MRGDENKGRTEEAEGQERRPLLLTFHKHNTDRHPQIAFTRQGRHLGCTLPECKGRVPHLSLACRPHLVGMSPTTPQANRKFVMGTSLPDRPQDPVIFVGMSEASCPPFAGISPAHCRHVGGELPRSGGMGG